ncbi:hypothetical protein ACJRO7_005359 [Eucalyptus globulus]|uniref:Uncharacterized protein n=1 Tax=Eucalyptus globulus TaxID=34317 RepID=A0ABD3J434_EUCGL
MTRGRGMKELREKLFDICDELNPWPLPTTFGVICSGRDAFYDPANSKVLKRGRTEAMNTFIIHQGEIQHGLGSRTPCLPEASCRCRGILDRILFFIADLEVASIYAKRCASISSMFIYVYNCYM